MTEIPAAITTAWADPNAEHIRVTRKDADQLRGQPWHCALIAGNHEETWWNETYADRDGARDSIAWLGRFVSPVHRATVYWGYPFPGTLSTGYLEVWLDDEEFGAKHHIPIRFVDERAAKVSKS